MWALGQQFVAWLWSFVQWLSSGNNLYIALGLLVVVLGYLIFFRRR
jgi:LPXTG-motif cell wall-anchored protein